MLHHGGFQVDKSGTQGLKTWYPPILRVRNPLLWIGLPQFQGLGMFGSENLKISR